jgi:RimJ/RimL family protein N-acetyltransferase
MRVRIRVLTPDDAQAFQDLRLQGLQTSPTAFSSSYAEEVDRPIQAVAQRLGAEASTVFGAFTEAGQLVGVTVLYREPRMKSHHKAFIFGMYVAPEYRGQGIGRALLEAAVSRARQLPDLRQLTLTVVASNQAAYSLYKSCGFETFGLERGAVEIDGNTYDVAYMTRQLEPGA